MTYLPKRVLLHWIWRDIKHFHFKDAFFGIKILIKILLGIEVRK